MKKFYFYLAYLFFSLQAFSQTGIHIQERTGTNKWIHNKDSVYLTLGSNNFSRMCIIDPVTKAWSYVNSNMQNYNKYMGAFVMRGNTEGVMIYPSTPSVYKTTDGWKTLT